MTLGPLSLRVPFRCEESAFGLFARLALRHGRVDVRDFATIVGINRQLSGTNLRARTEALAGFGLDPLAPRSTTVASAVGSETFRHADWTPRASRICLSCLADDVRGAGEASTPGGAAYRRFWWDFLALDVCPRHGTILRTKCPSCDADHDPWRADVRTCGRCLTDLAAMADEPLDPASIRADRYILSRLLGRPRRRLNILEDIPLSAVLPTMLAVTHAPLRTYGPSGRTVSEHRIDAKATAYKIFKRWPRAYHGWLDRILAEKGTTRTNRDEARWRPYDSIEDQLAAFGSHPAQTEIKLEYERHSLKNRTFTKGETLFGQKVTDSRWVTLSVANEYCELDPKSSALAEIVRTIGLVPCSASVDVRTRLPRMSLPSIRWHLRERVGQAEAARLLGVPVTVWNRMVAANLFSTLERPQGPSRAYLGRSEITHLLLELQPSIVGDPQRRKRDPRLVTVLGDRRYDVGRVLDAVRTGRVRIVVGEPNTIGLSGIVVSETDVRRLARKRTCGIDPEWK